MHLNDLPKISIVMPSLNQVQYVEEAILSVVRQEYPRLEFLVIDGGCYREIQGSYRLLHFGARPLSKPRGKQGFASC
jgi:cellulose synthase/poly-beta-1,6-N-acetylglucosamine synthase-like glycosyltransferase